MGYAVGRLVREVLLDVRHPAWTPVNPAGETPVLNGTATLAPNDWQPLATGSVGRSVGASPNAVDYRPDNGLMVTLSPGPPSDLIEDRSGDGDSVAQMVSHRFETPGERTLDFDWTKNGQYLERFIWTVYDDPTKRPLELRERYVDVSAAGAAAINNGGGYSAGVATPLLVDGPGFDDLEVGDLVTIDATATIYLIATKGAASITLDKPLVSAVADDDVVARAAIEKNIVQSYLVQTPGDKRGGEGLHGHDRDARSHG